ncbi:hypothetical protein AF72_02340 [Xylella taiwanensis]|uniref:Uncharacterized protein n=1 Tax=Xylella taiwanensis TaxID=1444770 RepID=Z9JMR5_9GAMM|nr:hypothetical protein AB672_09090 [Xylella taiwanensis]EWS79081.1 hypothetical protein AF72_02340 [Xylella taiwanensis]
MEGVGDVAGGLCDAHVYRASDRQLLVMFSLQEVHAAGSHPGANRSSAAAIGNGKKSCIRSLACLLQGLLVLYLLVPHVMLLYASCSSARIMCVVTQLKRWR